MKSRKMLLPHPLLVFINDVHSTPRQNQPCPRHHAVQFGVGVPILFLVSAAVPIIPTIPENRTTPDARAKTTNENLDVICSWFVRHSCNHRTRRAPTSNPRTKHHQHGMPREKTPTRTRGARSGIRAADEGVGKDNFSYHSVIGKLN